MENYKIDLSGNFKDNQEEKTKRGIFHSPAFRFFIFCFILLFCFFSTTIILSQGTMKNIPSLAFWEGSFRYITGWDKVLSGQKQDRINILLLGMGGQGHDGEYLTDTIILVSYKPSLNSFAIFSIPRDLYVPIKGAGWQKINYAYAFGEMKKGKGGELASQTIEDVFDIPVHYWGAIDFKNFVDLIDWLGGVLINVEEGFVDSQFPGENYTYRTVVFEPGEQLMDGQRVLEYVRSRHGTNGQASDFARAKRQQQVILAIKEKLKQVDILKPAQIWYFYNFFVSKIKTNLSISDALSLSKMISKSPLEARFKTFVLSDENFLYPSKSLKGEYILLPKGGSFGEISQFIKNIFTNEPFASLDKD